LYYAGERSVPWKDSVAELRYLIGFSWGFSSFHYGQWVLLIVGLLAVRRLSPADRKPVAFALCLLGAAYYAMLAPGRPYPHYLLLLTMPLALAAGLIFGHLLRLGETGRLFRTGLVALLVIAGVGGQIAERTLAHPDLLRLVPGPATRAEIVARLDQLKRPGDSLAVWGWRPELYVETQLPQGVRDAHTERQMTENPQRAYFRARYLADLETNRPAFFVDAVGRGGFLYRDRAASGLESFAALDQYVVGHYQLIGELDSFRLYLRRDRIGTAVP
jgi:hypothetical protein